MCVKDGVTGLWRKRRDEKHNTAKDE